MKSCEFEIIWAISSIRPLLRHSYNTFKICSTTFFYCRVKGIGIRANQNQSIFIINILTHIFIGSFKFVHPCFYATFSKSTISTYRFLTDFRRKKFGTILIHVPGYLYALSWENLDYVTVSDFFDTKMRSNT